MINVFQPTLGEEELAAVGRVFESNWLGKGKLTQQFETDFASYLAVDSRLIRSLTCCTEALFQAMSLLGIGAGDEVIVPTISFVGAANAVAASGARIVFCDVDPRTLNPTADHLAAKITSRTRAFLILHYGGVPCAMDEICALAGARGIAVIEDNACSVASRYKGRACGTLGDIGAWSFDAMKILVTGDGGMIYCRTPELAQRAEEQLYLGLLTKSGLQSTVDSKWWEFELSCYGRRAIMNDVTAAIGIEQLKKLPSFIARRREIHGRYDVELAKLEWLSLPPPLSPEIDSSYYFYWVQTPQRDRLARFLRDRGVYTTFRYFPLHRVGYYGEPGPLPGAERAADATLCIPIHQGLSDGDVAEVISCLHDFGREI